MKAGAKHLKKQIVNICKMYLNARGIAAKQYEYDKLRQLCTKHNVNFTHAFEGGKIAARKSIACNMNGISDK